MKQARTRAMFSLTVLLACCACTFALNPSLDVSQYAHTAWKVRDGFGRGFVNPIAQTPDGYLWLGTEFGLLRFDGVRAVPWQPPDDHHLRPGTIYSLLVSRDGTLWIGAKGLASWRNGNLIEYPELAHRTVFSILEDRDGTVWVSGAAVPSGKLCAIHDGSIHCYGDNGDLGVGVFTLYEDSRGNLWAGVKNGLWRWKPGPPQFFSMPEVNGIQAIAEDDDGALLVGWKSGIYRFVDGKIEQYSLLSASHGFSAKRMLRDRNGGLWIGTLDGGLVHLHQGRTDVFSAADGLSGDVVDAIFEDREGNIWVASTEGLDRFRDFPVSSFTVKEGLSAATVLSVLTDQDGSVWLSTRSGLNHWKSGRITIPQTGSARRDGKLNGSAPDSLLQDTSAHLFISTSRNVGYLEGGRFTAVPGAPGGQILSMTQDTRKNLWVANEHIGLFRISPQNDVQQMPWSVFGHKDHASVLAADRKEGGLWIGFFLGGVAHFSDGRVRESYTAADGLGTGRISDFQFDNDGTLWVSTEGGLSRLKNNRLDTLNSKNGLPCDPVHWSMRDDDQSMWLYTACGLLRISRSDLDAWAAAADRRQGTTPLIQVTVFDNYDGVKSLFEPGHDHPQVAKTPDGRIWFLPWDGVSVVDPRHIPFNRVLPPVHIEQVVADRKTYDTFSDARENLRLPPLIHDLEIDYTALSLVAPEKNRFRYKLEGVDREWHNVGNRRQAFYTDLPPRHYRFRLAACNNSGLWNEEGATLDFVIPPAWYQTNWFRGMCAAALLALLWAAYRLRVAQVEREERKLRETIETLPAMAWVTRPDGTNQFVNRRWLEYTGLSEKGAEGDSWKGLVHPEDVDRYVRRWLAVLAGGGTFEEEARVRAANGEYRWFLSRAVPLRDNRGKIRRWYGVSTDIEDRKRAEQLQTDLAHTNRITMLGELAASISHELKQPIAASITDANTSLLWLNRGQPDLDEVRQAAERIVKDGQRATEIIDRLRALYKKTPPKRELVDVNEIIREMVLILRSEANRFAVSIRTDLAADLPEITADRVQLQQVLMNLMLNGIEAMNETGGVLTIKSQSGDGHVHISVSDTGVGLPVDKTNKIFDAFYTTKPQGSGMGLAISRSIVQSHGGRLWATPNDGRGASFHFSLPTAAHAEEAPAAGA